MKTVRIALCQINSTVGDLDGNVEKMKAFMKHARPYNPDIVAFPELAVTGYPPEDLLLKPSFIADSIGALDEIRRHTDDFAVIVGFVDRATDIHNAAALIRGREIIDIYHKVHLPNYGVFDEHRYFRPGRRCPVYCMDGVKFGINICEDMWYPEGPLVYQSLAGAEFVITINASPFQAGKSWMRRRMLKTRAADNNIIIASLNAVGGQDELVFDGASLVADQDGTVIAAGKQFIEDMIVIDLDVDAVFVKRLRDPRRRLETAFQNHLAVETVSIPGSLHDNRQAVSQANNLGFSITGCHEPFSVAEETYYALVLGTRDYMWKNGFEKACIGLSGGIDSSFVAVIASDAIGRENVMGVFMPSIYTSEESREDAYELAANLGIEIISVPIMPVFDAYLGILSDIFAGTESNITEENLQSRIRGTILMAISNKFGRLVLATGNKSEMSVGYATLYGDMAGGLAVIKDVPKTLVYQTARWRNARDAGPVIPDRVFFKDPTAELRPGQKDTDSLPPYEILDPIIAAYVEREENADSIVRRGFAPETVRAVIRMIDGSEYKRRQSPPGIKITARAYGRDRRVPVTNKYR